MKDSDRTMVQNKKKNTQKIVIQSFTVPQAWEWAKGAEGASEASGPEQVNKWAVQANEQTDEQVAQYLNLYFWLFWPTLQVKNAFGRWRRPSIAMPWDLFWLLTSPMKRRFGMSEIGRNSWKLTRTVKRRMSCCVGTKVRMKGKSK